MNKNEENIAKIRKIFNETPYSETLYSYFWLADIGKLNKKEDEDYLAGTIIKYYINRLIVERTAQDDDGWDIENNRALKKQIFKMAKKHDFLVYINDIENNIEKEVPTYFTAKAIVKRKKTMQDTVQKVREELEKFYIDQKISQNSTLKNNKI